MHAWDISNFAVKERTDCYGNVFDVHRRVYIGKLKIEFAVHKFDAMGNFFDIN